jgi:hypothetical protein
MTEDQWLSCTDPAPMLEFLRDSGKGSDRKLRLFAVACCRRIWPSFTDQRSRKAVEVAERYADGAATAEELAAACIRAREATFGVSWDVGRRAAWATTWRCLWPRFADEDDTEAGVVVAFREAAREARRGRSVQEEAGEYYSQAALLRDLFGNPFHPLPPFDPSLLKWKDGAAIQLAQAIYERRSLPSGHLDATRLAILADMLGEAGCTDADVLGHLRSPGPHVRGCFAVDALLGKA